MVNTGDPSAQPDLFMRVADDDRTEIVLIIINGSSRFPWD